MFDHFETWLRPNVVALAAVCVLGLTLVLLKTLRSSPIAHLPHYYVKAKGVRENDYPTAESLLRDVCPKHSDSAFVIKRGTWRRWDTVVLPPKFVDSVKSLPEDHMSFYGALDTRFLHDYTTIKVEEAGGDTPMLRAIAIDLSRHLASSVSDLEEEVVFAFDKLLPECETDWAEFFPQRLLPRMISLISGRVLVGLPLSRDQDFLDLKLSFFKNSFIAMYLLGFCPPALRPLAATFLPATYKLRQSHATMRTIMAPIVEQRQRDDGLGKKSKPDLLSWVIKNAPAHLKYNVKYQAHAQLICNVASIQSLYVATSHALFDLAAHPECIDDLRREWTDVLRVEPEGKISGDGMQKLVHLDSFVKESQRYNPSQLTAFEYVLRKPVVLPDGTNLPTGTYLGAASSQIGFDNKLWTDPDRFDGLRFSKIREKEGNDTRYLFVSTGIDQLHFGYGRHPCPGRYFASVAIKLMLAKLLERYDVKLPDGQQRPTNIESGIALRPDDKIPIMIRKR